LESEQLYRRSCYALSGTNGHDEQGQNRSFRLSLWQLKAAVDLGHRDAQYGYGHGLCFRAEGKKVFNDIGGQPRNRQCIEKNDVIWLADFAWIL
jgi:hypothetical protein